MQETSLTKTWHSPGLKVDQVLNSVLNKCLSLWIVSSYKQKFTPLKFYETLFIFFWSIGEMMRGQKYMLRFMRLVSIVMVPIASYVPAVSSICYSCVGDSSIFRKVIILNGFYSECFYSEGLLFQSFFILKGNYSEHFHPKGSLFRISV